MHVINEMAASKCFIIIVLVTLDMYSSVSITAYRFQSTKLYKLCPERRRRNKHVRSGVARALSLPSVCDITQVHKVSSGLVKSKVSKQNAGEIQVGLVDSWYYWMPVFCSGISRVLMF